MPDYTLYRDKAGVTANDVVEVLRPEFPKFFKGTLSMADHPEKYGICLLPAAEKMLVERFGYFPGLISRPKKRKPNRRKPCRMTVWLTPELNSRIRRLMKLTGYSTAQEFLFHALYKIAENAEKQISPQEETQ